MELEQYEMESERLRFRRLRADDFALIAPLLQDEQTMYAWEHGFTYDEVCDWIADMLRRYQRGRLRLLRRAGRPERRAGRAGGPAGRAAVRGYETATGIGYIVRRDLWRQGYGRECARGCVPLCVRPAGRGAGDRRDPAGQPRLAGRRGVLRHAGRSARSSEALSGHRHLPHLICAIDKPRPEEKPPAQQTNSEQK